MASIITIDFHGDRLLGIEDERGPYIPLRPLVLGMGLDWSAQRKRVRRDPILSDASRVDEAVRDKVIEYQRHCFGVLAQAFLRPASNIPGQNNTCEPADVLPVDIARRLVTEARHTFDRQAGRELWFKLKLPIVPAMHAPIGQGNLFTYTAAREG